MRQHVTSKTEILGVDFASWHSRRFSIFSRTDLAKFGYKLSHRMWSWSKFQIYQILAMQIVNLTWRFSWSSSLLWPNRQVQNSKLHKRPRVNKHRVSLLCNACTRTYCYASGSVISNTLMMATLRISQFILKEATRFIKESHCRTTVTRAVMTADRRWDFGINDKVHGGNMASRKCC